MDPKEQDRLDDAWRGLGQQLHDFAPPGDVREDFAAFQAFSEAQQPPKAKGYRRFGLALLFLVAVTLLRIAVGSDWLVSEVVTPKNIITAIPGDQSDAGELTAPKTQITDEREVTQDNKRTLLVATRENSLSVTVLDNSIRPEPVINTAAASAAGTEPTLGQEQLSVIAPFTSAVVEEEQRAPVGALQTLPGTEHSVATGNTLSASPLINALPLADVRSNSRSAVIIPLAEVHAAPFSRPTNLHVDFAAGISHHWRGSRFMQEVDRGIYAGIGVRKDLGKRFSVGFAVGYRGHDVNFPIVSDQTGYWSHHTDKAEVSDALGNVNEYGYEGIVEGYRAVEFTVLLHYLPFERLSINGGIRYGLPALQATQLFYGPDDNNPLHNHYLNDLDLIRTTDFGFVGGLSYRLSRHLALEASIHLGQVDLIDDVAEEKVRFNHSSSVSLGVRYSLE